jgi:hypothetical protein
MYSQNSLTDEAKEEISNYLMDQIGRYKRELCPLDIDRKKYPYEALLSPEIYSIIYEFHYIFDFKKWRKTLYIYEVTKKDNRVAGYSYRKGHLDYDTMELNLECDKFFPFDNRYLVYYNPNDTIKDKIICLSGNTFYLNSWIPYDFNPEIWFEAQDILEERCFMYGIDKVDLTPWNDYRHKPWHPNHDSLQNNLYKGQYWEFEAYSKEIGSRVILRLPKDIYWSYFEMIYYTKDLDSVAGLVDYDKSKKFTFSDEKIYEVKYIRKNNPRSYDDIKPNIRIVNSNEYKMNRLKILRYCKYKNDEIDSLKRKMEKMTSVFGTKDVDTVKWGEFDYLTFRANTKFLDCFVLIQYDPKNNPNSCKVSYYVSDERPIINCDKNFKAKCTDTTRLKITYLINEKTQKIEELVPIIEEVKYDRKFYYKYYLFVEIHLNLY